MLINMLMTAVSQLASTDWRFVARGGRKPREPQFLVLFYGNPDSLWESLRLYGTLSVSVEPVGLYQNPDSLYADPKSLFL